LIRFAVVGPPVDPAETAEMVPVAGVAGDRVTLSLNVNVLAALSAAVRT
jgi:hypothetical protein